MTYSVKVGSSSNDRNSILFAQGKVAQSTLDFLYDPRMEIDKWVVAAREAKELTQGQLADRLGVTRGNVSAWENRRHEPSLTQIRKISAICGLDAAALLTDDDSGVTRLPVKDEWPFSFPISVIEKLSPPRRRELELIMLGFIAESSILAGGKSAEKAG